MKSTLEVCLLALALTCVTAAQDPTKATLRKGISVEMPVARHAVEMLAADNQDATVVTVTADGRVFVGVNPTQLNELCRLRAGTIYVKTDARASYQNMLSVLDALHGRPIVLLTAPPANAKDGPRVPPYGMKLTLGQ
jgi:biopolymer transport protein ExbD